MQKGGDGPAKPTTPLETSRHWIRAPHVMEALIHHVLPVLPNAFPGFPLTLKPSPLAEGSIALENAGGERHAGILASSRSSCGGSRGPLAGCMLLI